MCEVIGQVAIELGNGQPVPVGLRRAVLRMADLLRSEMQPSDGSPGPVGAENRVTVPDQRVRGRPTSPPPVSAENLVTVSEQHLPGGQPQHHRPDETQHDRPL
jgi:hypothetical protein